MVLRRSFIENDEISVDNECSSSASLINFLTSQDKSLKLSIVIDYRLAARNSISDIF